jgi:hypothetical protein
MEVGQLTVSNLDRVTGYPTVILGFTQYVLANAGMTPLESQRACHIKSVATHHSLNAVDVMLRLKCDIVLK